MKIPFDYYVVLAFSLFIIGLIGMASRKNLVTILMSLELSLNSVNIILIGIDAHTKEPYGQIFALFNIGIAATEAAIGLGIIVALFRARFVEKVDEITDLRG